MRALIAVTILVLLAFSAPMGLAVLRSEPPMEAPHERREYPSGWHYRAIETEDAAIERALDLYPEGQVPGRRAARLVRHVDASAFALGRSAGKHEAPVEPYFLRPVWLVGILGEDLSAFDIRGGIWRASDQQPMDGMLFAISAGSGLPVIETGISRGRFVRLALMRNQDLSIVFTTPEIYQGTPAGP